MSDLQINIKQDGKDNKQDNTFNFGKKNEPIPSNVRAGSKNFVGREPELEDIHRKLQAGQGVAICAVQGLGGIGKTELALQYAHKYKDDYVAQYWLPIRENGLAQAVVELAIKDFPLPEELKRFTLEQQAEWYWRHWLPAEGMLLVILDDVPDAESIPDMAMPLDERIKVLLTSQKRMLSLNFSHVSVAELPYDKAIEMLGKILGFERVTQELSTVTEVCVMLGYLPLGLELVGEYLAKNRHLSFEALQNRLHLADPALAQDRKGKLYGYRGVEAAIQLSWDDLSAASKQVAMLLGLFAKADIPWNLVEAVASCAEISEIDLQEARGLLDVLHLIDPVDPLCQFYKIHTLVREFFQKQLTAATEVNHQYQQAFVQSLLEVSKQIPQTPTLDQIALFKPAIPHLELLGRKLLEYILNPEQDLVWAFLGVAWYYKGQGLYALAEVPLQACLLATEQQLGADHPDTATSLNNLAELYLTQGYYSEAESLLIRSLQVLEEQVESDHPYISAILNNLANLYHSLGQFSNAEPLFKRSLQIIVEQIGIDNLYSASSLDNLASLYRSQGRYSEAEPLQIQSLLIREQLLGTDHLITAVSLDNLALLYCSQGRYSEAEPLQIRSFSIREQLLGSDHPITAVSLNNLAELYRSQGRYSEAEPLYLRCLEIQKKVLSEIHPKFATCLNNLATLYAFQGYDNEAEYLLQRSLNITKEQLGLDYPDTASSLSNLSLLYLAQGNYIKAQTLAQQALEIRQKKLDKKHPNTQNSLLTVKFLEAQILLSCGQKPLFSILKGLAQQAKLSDLNTEVALNLLEEICTNPELLHRLQELLSQYTKALSPDS